MNDTLESAIWRKNITFYTFLWGSNARNQIHTRREGRRQINYYGNFIVSPGKVLLI